MSDRTINSKTNAFLRVSYAPSSSSQRGSDLITPNVVTHDDAHSQLATIGVTRSFANGNVNDVRVNYSKFSNQASSLMDSFGGAIPLNDAIVFPKGTTAAVGSFSLNALGVAGYSVHEDWNKRHDLPDQGRSLFGLRDTQIAAHGRAALAKTGRLHGPAQHTTPDAVTVPAVVTTLTAWLSSTTLATSTPSCRRPPAAARNACRQRSALITPEAGSKMTGPGTATSGKRAVASAAGHNSDGAPASVRVPTE